MLPLVFSVPFLSFAYQGRGLRKIITEAKSMVKLFSLVFTGVELSPFNRKKQANKQRTEAGALVFRILDMSLFTSPLRFTRGSPGII